MKQKRTQKRLYSLPEAAEYLGRSEWSIRRLVWSGKLPHVRCGKRVHVDVQDMDTVYREQQNIRDGQWCIAGTAIFSGFPLRNSRFSALRPPPSC